MIDFYMPPRAIQLFDGRPRTFRTCGASWVARSKDGGYIAKHHHQTQAGLRPEPFAKAAYEFWLGGDFIKNGEAPGQPSLRAHEADHSAGGGRHALARHGQNQPRPKLFSANITADDHL